MRRGFAAALAAVALGALGDPTKARADTPEEGLAIPPIVFNYVPAAEKYWGRAIPCGIYRINWGPDDAYADRRIADAVLDECEIRLYPSARWNRLDGQMGACEVVAHEVGHLLGYEHTDDPFSIMEPVLPGGETTILAPCLEVVRPLVRRARFASRAFRKSREIATAIRTLRADCQHACNRRLRRLRDWRHNLRVRATVARDNVSFWIGAG